MYTHFYTEHFLHFYDQDATFREQVMAARTADDLRALARRADSMAAKLVEQPQEPIRWAQITSACEGISSVNQFTL